MAKIYKNWKIHLVGFLVVCFFKGGHVITGIKIFILKLFKYKNIFKTFTGLAIYPFIIAELCLIEKADWLQMSSRHILFVSLGVTYSFFWIKEDSYKDFVNTTTTSSFNGVFYRYECTNLL